jgi:malto-oligosyltrehalose trehalohydrolase
MEEGWFELLATGISTGSSYHYILADGTRVPDPAARAQSGDVHAPSLVVDPTAYSWRDAAWRGRPWEETVIYEFHVGTFTPQGTFSAAMEKLDHLVALGVTALEIMPVAQFSGDRNWGYDGVLLYAPHRAYGSPDDMKAFVDMAHAKGLMVFLDVVYNHFGPDGNYLPRLAPEFFDAGRSTPWGAAIAYERRPVRDFFIDNALYWLVEFHLDGLRLDAVDQICDTSSPELLDEIATLIRRELKHRPIHLMTEDNRNITRFHERDAEGQVRLYTGEWNDDFYTAAHVFATGETAGYFGDFAGAPLARLARALAEGFVYQGEASVHRGGKPRGESCLHLPPAAFIDFLQNHDQVGNRALGERLSVLADGRLVSCLTAVLLLSPAIPLIFMGQEWGEERPFLFFTDFKGELAEAVKQGRRREFSDFLSGDEAIPDPNDPGTFVSSKLDWSAINREPHEHILSYTRHLLRLRRRHLVAIFAMMRECCGKVLVAADDILAVDWKVDGRTVALRANLSHDERRRCPLAPGQVIFFGPSLVKQREVEGWLPPMSVLVTLEEAVDA